MNHRNAYVSAARHLIGDAADIRIEHGGKHPRIVVEINGTTVRHPFPGTPSDRRSLLNWRAQFKRRLASISHIKKARI